jgi:Eco57I restriction-modification methylase/MmeI, target recognition domain
MARDTGLQAHREWLGYVQPSGLVVSIPALLDANARLNQNFAPDHRRFLSALPPGTDGEAVPEILDFPGFAQTVFGWSSQDLCGSVGSESLLANLEVPLPDYHETLRPTYGLRDFQPSDASREWILLVKVLPRGADFDQVATADDRHWQATPQAKFERLLRQTHVPIGLLVNERQIRLVYAPEKELSGHITFNIGDMVKVAGRPILSAMLMLLHSERLYSVAEEERLPAILENSRKYQNTVSTKLAEQVVEALYELLRGFQAADDAWQGELLKDALSRDPEEVYRGLLTTLLRLVFVLYAEDRGLLSTDALYANHYSLAGLYERLRADDGRYHDTMGQRFGAWAQLLVLFRLIHSGARHGAMHIPAREGYLFDPERYRFLEGRVHKRDKVRIPRVSDGVIFNVLTKLRVLDGERLSYRTLAVEQIGSVYQAIMGFGLEQARGRSIAIKPAKKHGAPASINLEELLRTPGEKRAKWLTKQTDQKLTGKAADDLRQAATMEELLMALEKKIADQVTPAPVPKGAMIFQPSDERRKSGSHYTPSSLTGPIVEAALEPVLKQLGERPMPTQILGLKVCDLAMGSAAFLVETCRQLGDALVRAWHAHNEVPQIPLDEDEALFAQRMIAQRCLYGLDKNQMAADLAKLSLWLATLAKDHPFTFLDHSLRHGDALVGLTRKQIAAFHWEPAAQQSFFEEKVRSVIDRVSDYRQRILNARDNTPYKQLEQMLATADDGLSIPRMIGDAAIAAFFSAEKPKQREEARKRYAALIEADLKKHGHIPIGSEVDTAIKHLRTGERPTPPFHWELEFPEVFTTDKSGAMIGGFNAIVGNPPFVGGKRISSNFGKRYSQWIQTLNSETNGNVDLVAHCFRRAFALTGAKGVMGLVATNTIAQGDTRRGGLRWIGRNGGEIIFARRRLTWPGSAAVVVSVLEIVKGAYDGPRTLDGKRVDFITAFLLATGSHEDPLPLMQNRGRAFNGCDIQGQAFLFDDEDPEANPTSLMRKMLEHDPRNQERILPFYGGEDINKSADFAPTRWIIFFGDMSEAAARKWPELFEICQTRVAAERAPKSQELAEWPFWHYWRLRGDLLEASRGLDEILAVSQTGNALAFEFMKLPSIFGNTVVLFPTESRAEFAVLQSQVHRFWVSVFSSTMKDDLRYNPQDCFDSFPFPEDFKKNPHLDRAGAEFREARTSVMSSRNVGLTAAYNLVNDPEMDDVDIGDLRARLSDLDYAVLDAYGWTTLRPTYDFFPEFDDEESEDEGGRQKKKKFHYRWADEIRDEVLTRLLELNRQRALAEGQIVIEEKAPKKKSSKKAAAAAPLFEEKQ